MTLKPPTKERQRVVTVVYNPETTKEHEAALPSFRRKRVCAYARVSTEQDEQQNSYEAQIEYYDGYIKSKPEWEFIGIYADEGISGTSCKKRDGFNRMIEDALSGKIDLILTKSISRFSRNTVDSLSVTRKLKAHGVEVYFEKENISSMDTQAELLFTIMSSIAQEESRSISENVRWGKQRSMEAGKVSLAWSHFLGYTKGPDGLPQIIEEEATIVREIYSLFLSGYTLVEIANEMTARGYPTPAKKKRWKSSTIRRILTNEKYKGDARLQKTYTVDFLTKEVKVNRGERKQWYIHDSHDAIISPETFELVQQELERRFVKGGKFYDSPFTKKVICGDCGAYYGHRVWHSNESCRKNIWLCNDKYKHETICRPPKVTDYELEQAFILATNRLIVSKDYCVEYEREFLPLIGETGELEKKLASLREEWSEMVARIEQLVRDNAKTARDQDAYAKQFEQLSQQIEHRAAEIKATEKSISEAKTRKENARIFLEKLKTMQTILTQFDIEAWHRLVDYAKIMPDKTIVLHYRNGHEEIIAMEEIQRKPCGG